MYQCILNVPLWKDWRKVTHSEVHDSPVLKNHLFDVSTKIRRAHIILIIFWSLGDVELPETGFCVNLCALYLIFTRLLHSILYTYIHGTILRTGITWNKIPCYIRNSAFFKKAKIFWSYIKHFWIVVGVRKCKILIGLCK